MPLNVELLESSFAQIKVNSSEVTKQFYTLLFTNYPEVQPLFANTNMEKQRKQLFQSLVFTVNNLRKPDILRNTLRGLGTRHAWYGVLPQHYSMVGSSLLKAFEVSLGTAWTPDMQQAWIEAYEVVTQLMLEGADYSPESLILTGEQTMDTIALVPNNSLITETPEEGRQLAVKLARLIIKLTQPDEEKRKQLREIYGNDAMMLIAVGQTVATEFATIAAANNYWKEVSNG